MAVGAVLGAGSERSAESVPDAGAERLPVAVPCGAKRRMAPQRPVQAPCQIQAICAPIYDSERNGANGIDYWEKTICPIPAKGEQAHCHKGTWHGRHALCWLPCSYIFF